MIGRLHLRAGYDPGAVRTAINVNLERKLSEVPFYTVETGAISICGNAPSIMDVYPTDGRIVACNGAWRALVNNGVMPDYIVASDPIKENIAWFKDAPKEPVYYLASRMDPEIFDLLKDYKVFIWHLADDIELESVSADKVVGGGLTILLKSMNLFAGIGYDHFDIYGCDSCFAVDGSHHASEQNWSINDRPIPVQLGPKMYLADHWMISQVHEFLEQISVNRFDYTVDVKCPGLLQDALTHATLDVVYDLNVNPPTYNFLEWIINAENYREGNGFARLTVSFRDGTEDGFRPRDVVELTVKYKQEMIQQVCRPLIRIYGATEVKQGHSTLNFPYMITPSVEYYKTSGCLPVSSANKQAKKWALQFTNVYTITLRESSHWKGRNSNLAEWIKFALTLNGRVIFIRDTEKVDKPIDGFETCPEASINLHKRLALYRRAKMNYFVSNGPCSLATCSNDIPYVAFFKPDPEYFVNTPRYNKHFMGFDYGGQYPWATENQMIIWKDDTLENMVKFKQAA